MTSFEKLQRRIGGFPIEYPAAALMAAAVAFVTLAVPDWRFESAIEATGLPGIVSAAQPPLGTTARILAALGLGALSFMIVWVGLRALDARPQASDFPAFRAADLHPDAPRRRPILAGAEFGAPVDDLPSIEEQIGRRRPVITEPLPSFLAPRTSEPEARRPIMVPDAADEPEPAEPATSPAPAVETQAPFEEESPPVERIQARPEPDPAEAEMVEEVAPSPRVQTPPPAIMAGDHDEEEESVSELMARLESGLSRRDSRPVPGPSGSAQDALRRALGDLNRVSGRS